MKSAKVYDRAYFDKWYRSRRHAVGQRADLVRQVTFAVAAAEMVLAQPIASVLDLGAGEGRWQPILRRLAPMPPTSASIPASGRCADGARRATSGSGRSISSGTLTSAADTTWWWRSTYCITSARIRCAARRGLDCAAHRRGGVSPDLRAGRRDGGRPPANSSRGPLPPTGGCSRQPGWSSWAWRSGPRNAGRATWPRWSAPPARGF